MIQVAFCKFLSVANDLQNLLFNMDHGLRGLPFYIMLGLDVIPCELASTG